MNLKPETPLIKKLEIKRLEDECENLRLWRWRLTIAITVLIMLYIIMVFGIVYWLSLNIDEKQNHIKKTARGLKNVLKEYDKEEMVDIQKVSDDVKLLYDEYIQELPNAKKIFPNIIVWLDSILLQLSLERKRVQPLEKYYKLLKNVRDFLNTNNPYSNCTQYQQGILKDINAVKFDVNDGFHAATITGSSAISQYLPDFNQPGAVKDGEVEMVAATVLKNTKHAGVLRNIKIA